MKPRTTPGLFDDVTVDMSHGPTSLPHNGTDTSREAARSMEYLAPRDRARVLAHIRHCGGCTCDEVEAALRLSHQTASARINDLLRSEDIHDSGGRRVTRSGRKARVYVVGPPPQERTDD